MLCDVEIVFKGRYLFLILSFLAASVDHGTNGLLLEIEKEAFQ